MESSGAEATRAATVRFLKGQPEKPVFLFLHGLGTTNCLLPLAEAFHQEGYSCELLLLKGHEPDSRQLRDAAYGDWMEQLEDAYRRHTAANRKVFLVGFSIGGMLALDFACRHADLAGVLSVSTFLAPALPVWTKALLWRARRSAKKALKRRLQVTDRSTQKELDFALQLPASMVEMVIRQGNILLESTGCIQCPVLLIHSLDDQVASYHAVIKAVRHYDIRRSKVVTLQHLNHFLQFDIPPSAMVDLALEFFGLDQPPAQPEATANLALIEALKQCYEESRHWAGILFHLVVGFFSIFGVLVYYTLEAILDGEEAGAYYLVAYILAINIYLLLALLYFFYVARALVFLKQHLEPQLIEFPWVTYKTIPWAAGRISEKMTRVVFLSMTAVPGVTSLAVILYCLFSQIYSQRFLVADKDNVLLQAALIAGTVLWFHGARLFWSLWRYNRRMLYQVPGSGATTTRFQSLLLQLYSKVSPGCVRQSGRSYTAAPPGEAAG